MGRDAGDEIHIKPFSRYLVQLLETHGMDLTALAERAGLTRVTVSRHVNGHVFPHYTNRRAYAEAFGMTIADFEAGWRRPKRLSQMQSADASAQGVPIIGEVAASGWVESRVYEDDEPERLPISYPTSERIYALRIRGESMMPTYQPGDILIVQDVSPDECEDNVDAVVQLDGGMDNKSTFKRCILSGDGRLRLVPLNPRYEPIECRLENIVRIGRVLGKYVPVAALHTA